MIKFKEVAHHYLYCNVLIQKKQIKMFNIHLLSDLLEIGPYGFKPLLSPITDVYTPHLTKILSLNKGKPVIIEKLNKNKVDYRIQLTPTRKSQIYSVRLPIHPENALAVHFACSKGYDLFNLIENNEALDATKY